MYHPDINHNPNAVIEAKKINEAYETLSNLEKMVGNFIRRRY